MSLNCVCNQIDKFRQMEDYYTYKNNPRRFARIIKQRKIKLLIDRERDKEKNENENENNKSTTTLMYNPSNEEEEEEDILYILNKNQKFPLSNSNRKKNTITYFNNKMSKYNVNSKPLPLSYIDNINEFFTPIKPKSSFNFKNLTHTTNTTTNTRTNTFTNSNETDSTGDFPTNYKSLFNPKTESTNKIKLCQKLKITHPNLDPYSYKSDPEVKVKYLYSTKLHFAKNFKMIADNFPDIFLDKYGTHGEIVDLNLKKLNQKLDYDFLKTRARNIKIKSKQTFERKTPINWSDWKFGRDTKYIYNDINRRDISSKGIITLRKCSNKNKLFPTKTKKSNFHIKSSSQDKQTMAISDSINLISSKVKISPITNNNVNQ